MPAREVKDKELAFVFLEVDEGKEEKIMDELLKFDEVREVHEITGEKDILVVLEIKREMILSLPVPEPQKIAEFVTHKIAKVRGVRKTDTIIPTSSRVKTNA